MERVRASDETIESGSNSFARIIDEKHMIVFFFCSIRVCLCV